MRTLTGLWTSSEDVPDAWSLSPSEPIFTFSWTMPGRHTDANCNGGKIYAPYFNSGMLDDLFLVVVVVYYVSWYRQVIHWMRDFILLFQKSKINHQIIKKK